MKAKHPAREVLDLNLPELETLLERLRQESLDEESYQKLRSLLKAFRYLVEQIGDQDATISRLRALLAKPSTEKTSKVLEQAGIKVPPRNAKLKMMREALSKLDRNANEHQDNLGTAASA
jgi:hypothetical protein